MLNLPPTLLRSFLAVAETQSFTEAARRLNLRQSTISQHVVKLEQAAGQRLFVRTTHAVALTPYGDAMLNFASNILDANDRLSRFMAGSQKRERLRVGISEDFAMSGLAQVLSEFGMANREIELELSVGLSSLLYERFDSGNLDVIFAKRRGGDKRGVVAWRDRLVWIGRPGYAIDADLPVPLVTFAPPSITRSRAIAALEAAGRDWHITCSSGGLSGLRAAALAGLGVAAHARHLIPPGLLELTTADGLPPLGEVEFVVIGPGGHHRAAQALIAALIESAPNASARA